VCELEGPTPIFNISKTDIHSINYFFTTANIVFKIDIKQHVLQFNCLFFFELIT
jgi:hypothetical protein